MHDPMSVAFTVCTRPWHWPFGGISKHGCPRRDLSIRLADKRRRGCSGDFVTVWHVDPERRGNDDSCIIDERKRRPDVVGIGWRWRFHIVHLAWLRLVVVAVVGDGGFRASFFGSRRKERPEFAAEVRRSAPGWGTPGMFLSAAIPYPIVGWSITVWPWRSLRRWLLTRCERCGKGFGWNYAPVSHSWDGPKTRFLRGERGLYHHDCTARDKQDVGKSA